MLRIAVVLILTMATAGATPPRSLQREMLAAHNELRARVGVPPLVWSDRLSVAAQRWADRLVSSGTFEHSHAPNLGENLFEINGAPANAAQVADAWASEGRNYDYRSNRCRGVCGHYTQMVWRDTKEVGCAVASRGNREVWVCNYNPPGNYIGERPW